MGRQEIGGQKRTDGQEDRQEIGGHQR
jgi:hypothetical protein